MRPSCNRRVVLRADLAVLGRGAERARAPEGNAKVKVSWEVISVSCPHVARETVVPGKDLKGGPCGPTFAPAEGSQVLQWQEKPCLAFGHPRLEHNTQRAKFQSQHLLLSKVLGYQTQDILMATSGSLHNSSNFIIQPASETFQKLWKRT